MNDKVQELVESVATLKKISELREQLTKLESQLPLRLRRFIEDDQPQEDNSDKTKRTRIDPKNVIKAIKLAFTTANSDKLTKSKLVELTNFDQARITNALTKMVKDKDITVVADDDSKKKSKVNTAYKLKK